MSASRRAGSLALGQTRTVLGLKVAEYAGLVAFTVAIPRLMGPELYGRFSGIMATVGLLSMACGLGAQAVFGRFIPEYEERGETGAIRTLFTQYFTMRAVLSLVFAAGMVVLLPKALPESAGAPVAWGAAALICWCLALSCYQLFYGLNALGRWLVHDALVKLVLVAAILGLGGASVLSLAAAAMFVAEFTFLVVGLAWSRSFFTTRWFGGRSFLLEHVRFGLLFFGANVLLLAIWRGGEITVLVFSDSRSDIGFFNLASAVAMALSALIGQLAGMLAPSIAKIHVSGDVKRTETWLAYSLKYLTISAFGMILVIHTVGDLVIGVLLGAEFQEVATNLKILALALLPVAFVRTGITQAAVQKTPAAALVVGVSGLGSFLLTAALMVPTRGAVGASIAVALALGIAGVVAYFQFTLRSVLGAARYWRVMVVGTLSVIALQAPVLPVVLAGSIAIAAFVALLFGTGALEGDELRQMIRTIRS